MESSGITIGDGTVTVCLPVGSPIGVGPTYHTDRNRGSSTVRFCLRRDTDKHMGEIDTLAGWFSENKELTIEVGGSGKVGGCTLRECSLSPSDRSFYLQLFTPRTFQEARKWFD